MEILLILLSILLIGFFAGIEIAFVSANKLRIELLKEKGYGSAKIVSEFISQPSRFISTMLIGLNIALVLFASMFASYFVPERFGMAHVEEIPLLIIQTLITTFLVLIFGELIPKILFRVNSDSTLLFFAYPTKYLFYLPLKPLTNIFHRLSKWMIIRVLGNEYVEDKQSFSEADLEYLVRETAENENMEADEVDKLNSELFEKALYLKEVKIKSCMVPRMEMVALAADEPMTELRKLFIETKHSRIFIYDENIDKILGYVHHYDMLKKPVTIKEVIRTVQAVPQSMNAHDLLLLLIKERKNVAWVVDEYGGTAGIVTLEDLMEEIFGEIQDEHDVEDLTEKKISDHEFIFSGRVEVDYLNEEYELDIPTGEYETLSGYIVTTHEDIPEQGDEIEIDHFKIKVLKCTDKKIDLVNLQRLPKQEE